MAEKIDARGLSCPQPVVLTQNAIKSGLTHFKIMVDTEVSKENVLRCAEKNMLFADVTQEDGFFTINISNK